MRLRDVAWSLGLLLALAACKAPTERAAPAVAPAPSPSTVSAAPAAPAASAAAAPRAERAGADVKCTFGVGAKALKAYQLVTDADVLAVFGEPTRVASAIVNEKSWTLFNGTTTKTYVYSSTTIVVRNGLEKKAAFRIDSMSSSDPAVRVGGTVSPGATLDASLRAYPQIERRDPEPGSDSVVYRAGETAGPWLSFTVKGAVVTSVGLVPGEV